MTMLLTTGMIVDIQVLNSGTKVLLMDKQHQLYSIRKLQVESNL